MEEMNMTEVNEVEETKKGSVLKAVAIGTAAVGALACVAVGVYKKLRNKNAESATESDAEVIEVQEVPEVENLDEE